MWQMDWNKLWDVLAYDAREPMLFSSGLFLVLFLLFSGGYAVLRHRDTARLLFVTLFSYYFYYKCSGLYFGLLGVVTLTDFVLARRMARTESVRGRKILLVVSLLVNLGLLCYFKYTNFFGTMFSSLWGTEFRPLDIFLPVGISFFTFQSLSYTIDVYRRQIQPLDRLLDYAFYVSFFPQLVAGPIVRARDFLPQVRRPLMVSREMSGTGVFLILCGLVKKAVVSDYLSLNFVDRVFDNPSLYSGAENLLGVYGYALQIYCDFSGYSDMAIGLALLLGFRFPENFRSPYRAESVAEFWHRWHISLSTWLRDYLYISLGGNRRGRARTYLNLFLTMLLGGLWHGASWNFVAWGAMHGTALAAHKAWRTFRGKAKTDVSHGWRRVAGAVVTFHFVCLCWVFFRCATFDDATEVLARIATDFRFSTIPAIVSASPAVFLLMAVGYVCHFLPVGWTEACRRSVVRMPLVCKALLLLMAAYTVVQVKGSGIQPFIYFQF